MRELLTRNPVLTAACAAILLFATAAHTYFGNYDAIVSLSGFSGLDIANLVLLSSNFINDYPGSAGIAGRSIVPWVYPMTSWLGMNVEHVIYVMIALEITTLCAGAVLLSYSILDRDASFRILLIIALLALSASRAPNLANFGNPYFHGQFYGFADGFQMAAIAFCLRERFRLSAISSLIAFTIHPIKATIGIAFIGATQLGRRLPKREFVLPYVAMGILALVWMFLWLGIGTSQTISSEEFFRFAPLLNSHWFPAIIGIFTSLNSLFATPFLAALVIMMLQLQRLNLNPIDRTRVFKGTAALIALSFVGVVSADFELSAFLVKACFQRATVLILGIATIVMAITTIEDLQDRRWIFTFLNLSIVFCCFSTSWAWSWMLALIYVTASVLNSLYEGRKLHVYFIEAVGAASIVTYQAWLFAHEFTTRATLTTHLDSLELPLLVAAGITIFGLVVSRLQKAATLMPWLVVGLSSILGGSYWSYQYRQLPADFVSNGVDYKEAQLWAKANTPPQSLFMVDPCQSYGWRDFSQRSSFGSIHEWYKSGWAYTGDKQVFDSGRQRGARFGIDVDALIPPGTHRSPNWVNSVFCQQARSIYYAVDPEELATIVNDYSVDYLVVANTLAPKGRPDLGWSTVFNNRHYSIIKTQIKPETQP